MHLFLHLWHMYFLSPSCILIAPDLITIPLRVRRIPRCCTRTRPMLGKVSNRITSLLVRSWHEGP
jgi:hypothetical protein